VNKGGSSVSCVLTQGALGMATCLLLHDVALAQSLKAGFQAQQDDRVRVQAICEAQYRNAQFHPLDDYKTYRYMVSKRGVQAISPEVIQQSSGTFKCDRGEFEAPLALNEQYSVRELTWIEQQSFNEWRQFERDSQRIKREMAYSTEEQARIRRLAAGEDPRVIEAERAAAAISQRAKEDRIRINEGLEDEDTQQQGAKQMMVIIEECPALVLSSHRCLFLYERHAGGSVLKRVLGREVSLASGQ